MLSHATAMPHPTTLLLTDLDETLIQRHRNASGQTVPYLPAATQQYLQQPAATGPSLPASTAFWAATGRTELSALKLAQALAYEGLDWQTLRPLDGLVSQNGLYLYTNPATPQPLNTLAFLQAVVAGDIPPQPAYSQWLAQATHSKQSWCSQQVVQAFQHHLAAQQGFEAHPPHSPLWQHVQALRTDYPPLLAVYTRPLEPVPPPHHPTALVGLFFQNSTQPDPKPQLTVYHPLYQSGPTEVPPLNHQAFLTQCHTVANALRHVLHQQYPQAHVPLNPKVSAPNPQGLVPYSPQQRVYLEVGLGTKRLALQYLAQWLAPQRLITAGDSFNDVDMLDTPVVEGVPVQAVLVKGNAAFEAHWPNPLPPHAQWVGANDWANGVEAAHDAVA